MGYGVPDGGSEPPPPPPDAAPEEPPLDVGFGPLETSRLVRPFRVDWPTTVPFGFEDQT